MRAKGQAIVQGKKLEGDGKLHLASIFFIEADHIQEQIDSFFNN
ncbi:hypothetical protein [Actinoplanes utahensis]